MKIELTETEKNLPYKELMKLIKEKQAEIRQQSIEATAIALALSDKGAIEADIQDATDRLNSLIKTVNTIREENTIGSAKVYPIFPRREFGRVNGLLVPLCIALQYLTTEQRLIWDMEEDADHFDSFIMEEIAELAGNLPYYKKVESVELSNGTIVNPGVEAAKIGREGREADIDAVNLLMEDLCVKLGISSLETSQDHYDKAWDKADRNATIKEEAALLSTTLKQNM
jgi:hypothetical protein